MEYFAVFRYNYFPFGKKRENLFFEKIEVYQFNSADNEEAKTEALNHKQILEGSDRISKPELELLVKGKAIFSS